MISPYRKTMNQHSSADASHTALPITLAYNTPTSAHLLLPGILINIVVIIIVLLLNGTS